MGNVLSKQPPNVAPWPPVGPGLEGKSVNPGEDLGAFCKRVGVSVSDFMQTNFAIDLRHPDWQFHFNWYMQTKGIGKAWTPNGNCKFIGGETFYVKREPVPAPGPGITPPAQHPFRRGWTKASIEEFHHYVLQQGLSFANSFAFRMDCANFTIHLLMQFAWNNYLPVAFQYVNGVLVADFESILTFGSFMDKVKQNVGAPDLFNTSYPHAVSLPGFAALKAGDFLSAFKHVMVFYRSPSHIQVPGVLVKRPVMEILQGNLDTAPVPWREVPVDTRVQHRAFDLQIKAGYLNFGQGWEHREDRVNYQDDIVGKFMPRRWNFSWFNQVYGFPPV
jgi:hypothetical protein